MTSGSVQATTTGFTTVYSDTSSVNAAVQYSLVNDPVVTYLKPNSFKFLINRAPNVTYTCQSANIPVLSLGAPMQNTPFVDIPQFGDKVAYGEFTIRFLVNEDMSNYIEIHDWIKEIGVPYGGSDWGKTNTQQTPFRNASRIYERGFSDGALLILNSDNIPTVKLTFQDMFPISIEALDFDITTAGMEYFVGVATFRYKLFTISAV
jgi:hypothetical protein